MASNDFAGSRLAAGLALRAVLIAVLAALAFWLLASEGLYATGVVAAGAAVIAIAELARAVRTADRIFADFVEALAAGAADAPSRAAARFPALTEALAKAAERLGAERIRRERRIQELEALCDTVTAALLVVGEDGRAAPVNRAARDLCGAGATRLAEIAALGASAGVLASLAPGARAIVRLADQSRVLASAAGFRGGDGGRRRLISLQSLSAELSVVEIDAWQELVRVLAHEMMNSLTPIVSLAESLSSLESPATHAETAGAIEVIARRSAGLMSFVGRYRLVAELPAPRIKAFAAADLVAGIERLMQGLLGEKDIAFKSRVEPPGARISADPELLEQALINLLKNAIEAVEGCVSPGIELACIAGEGQVTLSVADTGRGLPAVDPEQVFTPFFTTKAGGSGIGLSLARRIAFAHGGLLVAAANSPQGTVFSLTLPNAGGS